MIILHQYLQHYQHGPIQMDPNGVVELLKNLITHKASVLTTILY